MGIGGAETAFYYYNTVVAKDVAKGSTSIEIVDAKNNPEIKNKIDANGNFIQTFALNYDNDPKIFEYSNAYLTKADLEKNIVYTSVPIPRDIKAGERLYRRPSATAFSTGDYKKVIGDNTWRLYSENATVRIPKDRYDLDTRSIQLATGVKSSDEFYLDDIEVGYSTKIRLYRDGSKIYEGFDSQYNDTNSIDKVKPDNILPRSISANMKLSDNKSKRSIEISFDTPEDNGNIYNYQVSSVSSEDKESPLSESVAVNVVSGIKGYSYIVDKNPNTIPDNKVDVETSKITHTTDDTGVYYIHMKAIDNAGNYSDTTHYKIDIPVLKAEAKPGENLIRLDWSLENIKDKTFKIFQKKEGSNEYQTISTTNLEDKKQVRVLNIYPYNLNMWEPTSEIISFKTWDGESIEIPKSGSLKKWMEEPNSISPKGYGKGIIEVESVEVVDFDNNPDSYLKNSDGSYKYDVIAVGFWDSNAEKWLSEKSIEKIREFTLTGRGLLLGHDVISTTYEDNKFRNLRDIMNIQLPGDNDVSLEYVIPKYVASSTEVLKNKKGMLNNYPWDIHEDKLTIPMSHTSHQWSYGDTWFKFSDKLPGARPSYENIEYKGISGKCTNTAYLSTWGNTAMIQTGHSGGSATEDEQKLLANTLFYLNQLSNDTFLNDNSGQDLAPPNKPNIMPTNINGKHIDFKIYGALDKASTYEYYVESTDKSGDSSISNIVKESISTGIKGYSYVLDRSPDTVPNNNLNVLTPNFSIDNTQDGLLYLHIKAIDNAGNVSETTHITINNNKPIAPNIRASNLNWTKDDVTIYIDNPSVRNVDYIITETQYRVNAGEWVKYLKPFDVDIEGISTIEARNVDGRGVYSDTISLKVKIDKTKPIGKIDIPSKTNTRNIIARVTNMADNLSGISKIRLSAYSDFSVSTGYLNIADVLDKDINIELPRIDNQILNFSNRIVYLEITDIAGNITETTASIKYEAKNPNKPIIIKPIDNSSVLNNQDALVSWQYSDSNSDLMPLEQDRAVAIFTDIKTKKEYSLHTDGIQTSLRANGLPRGEYDLRIEVYNTDNKKNISEKVRITINVYSNTGRLISMDIDKGSPIRYIKVITSSDTPIGTSIEGRIYYVREGDDNFNNSDFINFKIDANRDKKANIIDLKGKMSKVKIVYLLEGNSKGEISPILDSIKVLGK